MVIEVQCMVFRAVILPFCINEMFLIKELLSLMLVVNIE